MGGLDRIFESGSTTNWIKDSLMMQIFHKKILAKYVNSILMQEKAIMIEPVWNIILDSWKEVRRLLRVCKNSANVGRVAKYKLEGSELAGVWFRGAVLCT